jgi:hypothetical protein
VIPVYESGLVIVAKSKSVRVFSVEASARRELMLERRSEGKIRTIERKVRRAEIARFSARV